MHVVSTWVNNIILVTSDLFFYISGTVTSHNEINVVLSQSEILGFLSLVKLSMLQGIYVIRDITRLVLMLLVISTTINTISESVISWQSDWLEGEAIENNDFPEVTYHVNLLMNWNLTHNLSGDITDY